MKNILRSVKRSLPTRLLLVFIVTSLLLISLLIHTIVNGFSRQWLYTVRPHLIQYLEYVNADLNYPPDPARADALAKRLPINIYILGDSLNYSSTGFPLDLRDLEFFDEKRRWRKHLNPEAQGQMTLKLGEHRDRTVLRNDIGDYKIYYELLHRDHRDGVLGKALVGMLLLLAVLFLVIRRMLRPVQDIKSGVRLMGEGQLQHRVPIRANNDLGELAGSINSMAADIQQMLDAKRQLLLGVSHELRSPLTRASVAIELLEDTNNKRSIKEDLLEMENLIAEIMEAEKFDTPHSVLNPGIVNIETLILSVVRDTGDSNISLDLQQNIAPVTLDEARIKLALRNVINNAIKYGGQSSPINIELRSNFLSNMIPVDTKVPGQRDWAITITVSDSGSGIAPEHINKVTEPFYRVDPSRTRSTGGFGLGLYLVRRIIEAHGGHLSIGNRSGGGTNVEISLPYNRAHHSHLTSCSA